MNINDVLQEPIWNNRHFVFDGKPVFFKNWIKSNILYVNDLFTDNWFKSLNDIGDEVYSKANLLCEYKIISPAFKNIRNIVDGVQANFFNIKNQRTFLFFKQYCTIENKKCNFSMIYYYIENLNLQNIIVLEMYNIFPENWRYIYLQNIKLALDKIIAEFNYNLLHNILSCKTIMFKWKKDTCNKCTVCSEIEDIQHLVFTCENV